MLGSIRFRLIFAGNNIGCNSFGCQSIAPRLVRLQHRTLRMDTRCRVGRLSTNRTKLSLRLGDIWYWFLFTHQLHPSPIAECQCDFFGRGPSWMPRSSSSSVDKRNRKGLSGCNPSTNDSASTSVWAVTVCPRKSFCHKRVTSRSYCMNVSLWCQMS